MSMSFGKSTKKGKTSQEVDPWEPTIAPLTGLIEQIGQYSGNVGATDAQTDAFAQLSTNAAAGDPNAPKIAQLSSDLFGADNHSGTVEDAYKRITDQLGGTANGDNLDVANNPYLAKLMQSVGDNIQNRIGAQFAGSGRDITGNAQGQKALGKGIEEGTLPALFAQYNLERQNQTDAAKTLFGAGNATATSMQGLDTANFNDRLKGIDAGKAALDAENYGPNMTLLLEQQMKQLPLEDLGRIEALLGPIAQLGQQGSGTSKQSGTSFGLGANLLSDERAKEGVDGGEPEEIGKLADGTPILRYRYKDDPQGTPQIGVMAQDVEKKHPEAVDNLPGGLKTVNYELATDEAARKQKLKQKR